MGRLRGMEVAARGLTRSDQRARDFLPGGKARGVEKGLRFPGSEIFAAGSCRRKRR